MFGLARALLLAGLVILPLTAAVADDDHDRVLGAYERGEIVSLDKILTLVTTTYDCRVLEVELEHENTGGDVASWIYEITAITAQGNVLTIEVHAKTMEILKVSGLGAEAAKKP